MCEESELHRQKHIEDGPLAQHACRAFHIADTAFSEELVYVHPYGAHLEPRYLIEPHEAHLGSNCLI